MSTKTPTTPFIPKKSLGQNFLTSDVVPGWMCEAGEIKTGETVLEIGPGTGALTRVLLDKGAIVHALETDERAIETLKENFSSELSSGQLTLHKGDAREYSFDELTKNYINYKIVANIPYYLSGFLLRTCLELNSPPKTIVFLMQKEVVARIAKDKKQSLLSLSVSVYGEAKYYKTVSKGHFSPIPKIDSAILVVKNITHKKLPTTKDRKSFFELLHLGLGQKRKQLLGNLTTKYDRQLLVDIFTSLDLASNIRGEDVSLAKWLDLYHALSKACTGR